MDADGSSPILARPDQNYRVMSGAGILIGAEHIDVLALPQSSTLTRKILLVNWP